MTGNTTGGAGLAALAADTVAAIATPLMPAAIGVIRISGPDALRIADKICRRASGRALAHEPTHTAHLVDVVDAGGVIDRALALVMRAPRSYTGEDTAELFCHGGPFVLEAALSAAVAAGARPAGPGEFSRRAFLNGKLDLTEAEGIIDLITAENPVAARVASAEARGLLRAELEGMYDRLLLCCAEIMADADFPDEGLMPLDTPRLERELKSLLGRMDALLETYPVGSAMKTGVRVVIAGRPNVGKSSLLNAISGDDRAIVTATPGTTRDTVEHTAVVQGLPLRLIDTAGLRDASDEAESLGVRRAREAICEAQVLLCVFDGSRPLEAEDLEVIELAKGRPAIAVLNKCDLPQALEADALAALGPCVRVSAATGAGLPELGSAIAGLVRGGRSVDARGVLLTNLRQRDALARAAEHVRAALLDMGRGVPADVCEIALRESCGCIAEITGANVTDEMIDRIFERFCVGK